MDNRKIFITGDCHGDYSKFNTKKFPEQKELSKEDYMIVCGDFGGIWLNAPDKEEKYNMDILENRPFTTLWVDGNHENFDRLYSMPVKEWHGGKVHCIRPSVLHLMRGQVFEINGKSFFTFGGARSHDISGGILDPDDPMIRQKARRLDLIGLSYRVKNVSWWERELPTEEEMEEGFRNLEKRNWQVDYVITHCAPSSFLHGLESDPLTDYLEEIFKRLSFKKWYFGHYHGDGKVGEKGVLLYDSIVQVAERKSQRDRIIPRFQKGDLVIFHMEGLPYIGRVSIIQKQNDGQEPLYGVVIRDPEGNKHLCAGIPQHEIKLA